MALVLKVLRDPIWQAIGALVAVVALLSAGAGTQSARDELSVMHSRRMTLSDEWLPTDRIKLLVEGAKQASGDALVDYFTVINTSPRAIMPVDFSEPLSVSARDGAGRILAVESCSQPMAEACSPDGASTPDGASYLTLAWQDAADRWSAEPVLINPSDQACVIVVSEAASGTSLAPEQLFEWGARITNIQLKVYPSAQQYYARTPNTWGEIFGTVVILQGLGVYWFVLLQSVIFVATMVLASQADWFPELSRRVLIRVLLVVLVSTSTAEILVDVFINHRGRDLHWVVWPLLATYGAFVSWLIRRSLRLRRIPTAAA